jgi:hypothetical protein
MLDRRRWCLRPRRPRPLAGSECVAPAGLPRLIQSHPGSRAHARVPETAGRCKSCQLRACRLGLRGSLDVPFLRLTRLCRSSAAARSRPSGRVRQGRGAGAAAAPAVGSRSSAAASAPSTCRSGVHRCACATAPAPPSSRARGHAGDATALASRASAPEVDVPTAEIGPSTDGAPASRSGAAARAREPALGLSTDRWRAAQAWFPYLPEHGSASACRGWARARAAARSGELAGVSAPPGRQPARLRLLHR